MSQENTPAGKGSALIKIGKGFLTKIFNTSAEDKRVMRTLKNLNAYQLGQAIVNGLEDPQTKEKFKLTDKQKNFAQLERLKRFAHLSKPK